MHAADELTKPTAKRPREELSTLVREDLSTVVREEQSRTSQVEGFTELGGRRLSRQVLLIIANFLEDRDLQSLSKVSKSLQEICSTILQQRKINNKMLNKDILRATELPHLTDIISPMFPPPAVLATTIPQICTISTGGTSTVTVPQNTQIVVPVLPECIPLIAKIPDVVASGPSQKGEKQEVMISQVLPGYAPSYASDYFPAQINSHSFNTFVNTMSFNVSRYPTLADVTESRNYVKSGEEEHMGEKLNKENLHHRQSFEYVPAEYFTGSDSNFLSAKLAQSQSVSVVKPEVLSSGRLLTTMTVMLPPNCATLALDAIPHPPIGGNLNMRASLTNQAPRSEDDPRAEGPRSPQACTTSQSS